MYCTSQHTKVGASVVTAHLQNCLSYAFLNGRLRQVSVQRPPVLKVRSLTPGSRVAYSLPVMGRGHDLKRDNGVQLLFFSVSLPFSFSVSVEV